jgi:hypothetical protein
LGPGTRSRNEAIPPGNPEIPFRIATANAFHQLPQQTAIIRHFPALDFPANQVTQNAAEVFVPRE